MSQDEIEALNNEIRELSEKLSEINQKKQILIQKKQSEEYQIRLEADKRKADAIKALQHKAAKVAEKMEVELRNKPQYSVDFNSQRNSFTIKVNERGSSYHITSNFQQTKIIAGLFEIPAFESYRIKQTLKDYKVGYSELASKKIDESVENRKKMDIIALQKDTDKIPSKLFTAVDAFELKPTQKVFVEFFEAGNGRVLCADPTGMGKTAQALACVKRMEEKLGRKITTVIICPALAKVSWERAVYQLMDKPVSTFYGTTPEGHHIKQLVIERPEFSLFNYDIIARASHVANEKVKGGKEERFLWIDLLNGFAPDLVIIDECHYAKNLDTGRTKAVRQLKCKNVILLSGTPMLNRPGEMWPSLNIIDAATFDNYDEFIRQFTYNNKEPKNTEQLRTLLRPIMIRRKRDYTDAVVQRIPKYHELSEKAQRIYAKILAGIYEMMDTKKGDSIDTIIPNILVQIMRMKQICAIDKIQEVVDFAEELYNNADHDDKYKKVIIFSQFVPIVHAIADALEKRNPGKVYWVTGEKSHGERDRIVQEFQKYPDKQYLVASAKSIKENHTITASSKTIFVDLFWTPADHEQCEGRSFARINDPHGIDAYYYQTVGTIEDWCMDLLFGKDANIKEVVDGVEQDRQASIAGSIVKRLFEEHNNMFATVRKR